MRVRLSKKKEAIDKQQIINYQYEMIALSLPLVEPTITNTHKYSPWELEKKIKETVGQTPSVVRWIGNSETAYLEIYAYILLIGTGHSQANILQFKHTVYKLGKRCLELAEQKLLVQFLCLIEYSKDRYSFLNKYPQIQAIFIKILQYLQQQHTNSEDSNPENNGKAKVRRKHIPKARSNDNDKKQLTNGNNSHRSNSLSHQQIEYEKQLQQIYQTFNNYFQFISLTNSNEYSCTLQLFQNKRVYVVIEKQCYFMVQNLQTRYEDIQQFTLGGNKEINGLEKHLLRESSSLGNFDKKQFLDIFNQKNQIQESNVISIQRGSQVRLHSAAHLLENMGNITTPKFTSFVSQHFQNPSELQIRKNEEKKQNDRSFIELLNNVALNTQKDHSKSLQSIDRSQTTSKKKKYMEQKMKCIQKIKEQLKIVRQRIEGKIKLIDEAHVNQSSASKKDIKPYSQRESFKLKIEEKQFKSNIIKESVVKKFQNALFLKKQRKTSYNSVKIIPYSKGTRRVEQNCQIQSPLPQNRGSAKPTMQRVQRMLSEKAVSRPPSGINQIAFEQHSGFRRKKSPDYKRRNDYNIHSLSPKNVNVNVNVNINENLLHPHAYNQGSYQANYQQVYKDNRKGQYYGSSNHRVPLFMPKNMEMKAKFPPFLEKKRNKVLSSQNSLISMNKTAFTKNN